MSQPPSSRVDAFVRTQQAQPVKPAAGVIIRPEHDEVWTHARVERLPVWIDGGTVVLGDGSLLMMREGQVCTSRDNGQSWQTRPMWPDGSVPAARHGCMFRCASGTLLLLYLDMATRRFEWDNEAHTLASEPRLHVALTRSTDDGRTWSPPATLCQGYCGCVLQVIQMRGGRLVAPLQQMLPDPWRHVQATFVSDDEGLTWGKSNLIDIGGHGHHDGCFESVVAEIADERLWMLLRTNLDRFWQAFSDDAGLSWRTILPTDIDASSAPANLLRLAGGRLMMVWNRQYPQGITEQEKAQWEGAGGDLNICHRRSSWHRRELSLAFSDDDGAHWTDPIVIARGRQISYPFLLERHPGEVWISTQFGPKVSLRLFERDFADLPATRPTGPAADPRHTPRVRFDVYR
jgi:hypothetical protein